MTAAWRAHKRGALFANPCFTQIHPTCIPVSGDHQSKLTLMSESLRNDGRVWVPKKKGDTRPPDQIPEDERDYYLERRYPSFGNLVPRDVASRAAKQRVRRRPRRRRYRAVGLSRFQGRHPAAGHRHHQGALRQPVRDVRADHRRGSLQGSDAHLPRHPLHDGRACGWTTTCRARFPGSSSWAKRTSPTTAPTAWARARSCRGWRTATSSRPTRWRTTWPARRCRSCPPITTRSRRRLSERAGAHRQRAGRQGHAHDAPVPPRAGPHHVGLRRHGAHRSRAARRRSRRSATLRDEFWQDVRVPGEKNNLNPDARLRRPGGRLHGVRRAARRWTRCTATSPAAVTSARNTRRPTAKRSATTSNYSYVAAWEFTGVGNAARAPQGTADLRRSAPVAAELQVSCKDHYRKPQGLAPGGAGSARPAGRLRRQRRLDRHVVPRDAGRGQRGPDPQGRRRDRLRLGLPRRHLRRLRLMINGVAHGPDAGATTCQLHMRRFKDGETITVEPWRAKAFPVSEGSDGRSLGVRPDSRGRRLHLGGSGRRAGRQRAPDSEGHVGPGDGLGRLHRLRCVRGGLQERRGAPVHQRKGHPPRAAAAGTARNASAGWSGWSIRWRPKASATARTKANAKPSARS